jgi:hypothetical protein
VTSLENLRQHLFLSRRQLGRMVRLPARSVEALENGCYPLSFIGTTGRAVLESGLQQALNTEMRLCELLTEA